MADHGVIWMDHPEVASLAPPTQRQWELLAAVCQSNGGGVSRHDWSRSTIKGLMDRHLVQGKSGSDRIVHTREGLALYRAKQATPA